MSRDPEAFIKPELIPQFKEGCAKVGHLVIITSVDRTMQEQTALYAQGRCSIEEVNIKRRLAGLVDIKQEQNKIVTWTMQSKHIPDGTGKSHAFDFAIVKNGKVCWNIKADVDADGIPDYEECAKVGEGLGLRSGRTFKNPDYPHLEIV
ncbi:MAG: M15 family metallopeptidase [Nitrospirae bacterium]|nr:M15 family metallopeptidase [Nitrospirota bacterium]